MSLVSTFLFYNIEMNFILTIGYLKFITLSVCGLISFPTGLNLYDSTTLSGTMTTQNYKAIRCTEHKINNEKTNHISLDYLYFRKGSYNSQMIMKNSQIKHVFWLLKFY